jgi:Histidine kinase-, DNA gyrase B-, and HSP90-like ATPase
MLQHEIVPPDAAGTIESVSALGYSLESAIADIVDNSLDASASRVDVVFHWAGSTRSSLSPITATA